MRKLFTSVLTVLVLAAAIFTCCGEMKAFASLFAPSKAHDCCKKNLPKSSEHQSCDCHHEISAIPSQASAAQLVQDISQNVIPLHFVLVDFPVIDHLAAAVFYDGPPDDRVSKTPLYYQFSTLRL